MSIINNGLLLAAEAAAAGAYEISRSLRFNSADSAYLNRTPASASNRKTWTWAGWVKRSKISDSVDTQFFSAGTSGASNLDAIGFTTSDTINFYSYNGSFVYLYNTTAVFRDPSAWYHIVAVLDTTNATSTDRVKLYVNGVRVTTFASSTAPSQNADGAHINTTNAHYIGKFIDLSQYFNGYLADVHFIDGQALDPTSFGEFDTNGVWQPKAFSGGSYGTNGFRLTFSDNSGTTSTTLGKDAAGSNNWTPNNFSVAAGSGNDSLVDVPQNGDQTDTGAGGEVRGNYCTINQLSKGSLVTLANGNLEASIAASSGNSSLMRTFGTISPSAGSYYFEVSNLSNRGVGIATENASQSVAVFSGGVSNTSGGSATGGSTTFSTTDIIGVALDASNNSVTFYKNNTQFYQVTGMNSSYKWFPFGAADSSTSAGTELWNFGSRPFAYTAPSGFKALCTTNLPTPTIADGSTAMDVALYTGNSSTQTISGLGFSPDLVWIKVRSQSNTNNLYDTIRGVNKELVSNSTSAEVTYSNTLTAFNSDGFSIGSDGWVNASSQTFVAWTWDAGSSTVTNTSGSISAQVRAAPDKGFSVVTYTGSSSGSTVGHGLNVAPEFIFGKRRDGASEWSCYHKSLGNNQAIILNTTAAASSSSTWNYTTPTSTVVSLGAAFSVNYPSYTHVLYCFAPVAGYSAFGSYTGNGSSDGPFVYTGMRPRWIVFKQTNVGGQGWFILDTARSTYNVASTYLLAQSANAEASGYVDTDFCSNGFKIRSSDGAVNASGGTYIYAAFAENPFQYARAR